MPLDQLLSGPEASVDIAVAETIEARVARLRTRAARLKTRTVIDRATRARMDRGVQIPDALKTIP